MNEIVVIEIGAEGGGVTVLGREVAGQWTFWNRGNSIDLDDESGWRGWESKPTSDLFALLPDRWYWWYPIAVHPDFKARVRAEYERRAKPNGGNHERWLQLLS